MKLVFNQKEHDCVLAYVECNSLEEADQFMAWMSAKLNPVVSQPQQPVIEVKPDAQQQKVSRNDVSQAAIALVQTKGREVLQPILAAYSAKRISDIPEEKLAEAFTKIKEAS